jgi:hypothetical protein
MYTFLLIILTFILIATINNVFVKTQENRGRVIGTGMFLIFFGILFINFSGYFKTDEEINEEVEIQQVQEIENDIQKELDSVKKIPKNILVASAYKNLKIDKNDSFLESNKLELEALYEQVKGTIYEERVIKSIDSINKVKSKIEEKKLISERKEYETTLRNSFLDNNLNIRVKVSGSSNTKITLSYPLFNEVWFRKFQTEGHFDKLARKGFKKITLTDNYDYTQWMTYQ